VLELENRLRINGDEVGSAVYPALTALKSINLYPISEDVLSPANGYAQWNKNRIESSRRPSGFSINSLTSETTGEISEDVQFDDDESSYQTFPSMLHGHSNKSSFVNFSDKIYIRPKSPTSPYNSKSKFNSRLSAIWSATANTIKDNDLISKDFKVKNSNDDFSKNNTYESLPFGQNNENFHISTADRIIKFNEDYSPVIQHDYRECSLLPGALIPVNRDASACDEIIRGILSLIEPTVAQMSFRVKIQEFLHRLVKRALAARLFDTGFYALRSYLPDDPICISLFMRYITYYIILYHQPLTMHNQSILSSRTHELNWTTFLREKFSRIAEGLEDITADDDSEIAGAIEEMAGTSFAISNINVISGDSASNSLLKSVIDGVGIEITANDRYTWTLPSFIYLFFYLF
jgi:hypothetical protein